MDLGQVRERLVQQLSDRQLTELTTFVPPLARRVAALQVGDPSTTTDGEDRHVVGLLGGVPDLPSGFSWPTDDQDRPMIPWLEIDLDRLPVSLGLPPTGTLVAFLARTSMRGPPDRIDCDSGWLTVLDPETPRASAQPPSGTPVLTRREVTAQLRISLPSSDSLFLHQRLSELGRQEEALWDREWELEEDELPPETPVEERYRSLIDELYPPGPAMAWLLGHTQPCQDDPLLDLVVRGKPERPTLAESLAEAQRHCVLLQAHGAASLGYDIMSGGMVYAMLPNAALEAGSLEGATWLGQR